MSAWTRWPSWQALSGQGLPRIRRALDVCGWATAVCWLVRGLFQDEALPGWERAVLIGTLAGCTAAMFAFRRVTVDHRLLPALALVALLIGAAAGMRTAGADHPADVVWGASAILAMERLPLLAGVGCGVTAMGSSVLTSAEPSLSGVITGAGLLLIGYTLRLDDEARGSGYRLLAQERAARRAEAETAALAERTRIAREIHDVLAHSLSAQLVHLEAARLLIERGEDSAKVLERVVAARGMAREGLTETRQALSALRGEMVPVEDFLRDSAAAEGAGFATEGERRRLSAEAGLAVRRVAQEALTNVRKHAPGARVRLRLVYGAREVALEVSDDGAGRAPAGAQLAATGSGYGLLGMRERAALLGGSLEAGPAGEGFTVRLRVPL
ncbi:sensor histidine kinase [Streptomyces sp. NA02950]|uniref:sensor histidine kinase n=1 Tax=Streptomyces sp. NA02950 TaxID=2742137 RepID=UPI00158FA8CE|nr:histidine kinase [Streptomyces sp. NA02950]QKV92159.1 sensor histidine kinase [Streptomyces sp. NA02950]